MYYRKVYNKYNEKGSMSLMVDIDGIVNEDFIGEQLDAFNDGIKNKEYLYKCGDSYMRTLFFQE